MIHQWSKPQILQAQQQPQCKCHCLPRCHPHKAQQVVLPKLQMGKQMLQRQATETVMLVHPLLDCRHLPRMGSGAEEAG